MKINLAKSSGFCFGVKRAIEIAAKTARSHAQVEMLGDIVHNENVVKDIEKKGIKKIAVLKKGENKTLLIRAHGTSEKIVKKARDLGYRIVDATCPMVKEIHKISKAMENKCQKIIIIGDKKHAEVKGIIGHLKRNPLVIDKPSNIPFKKIKKIKKACMVIQSTQNQENVGKIFNLLKQHIKDLKLFNTICNTTKAKQKEIMTLPLENDIMIIIGSKISANTRRLYEISKNLNSRTFWIDSETQLRKDWFKKAKTVGIHAGASTPDYIIEKIVKIIRRISKSPAE